MSTKKDNALGLYMEGIRDGNPVEALNKYIERVRAARSIFTGIASISILRVCGTNSLLRWLASDLSAL